MIYNVVLILLSSKLIQLHIRMHYFCTLFHYGLSQNIEYSSLCCKTLLLIHSKHDSFHLLIPHSQFTPLAPQTLDNHKSVLNVYESVSILFFLWLSSVPLYICNTFSLSIHLSVDIKIVFMSWLLWTVLLWT